MAATETSTDIHDDEKAVEDQSASHIGKSFRTTVATTRATGTTVITGERDALFFPDTPEHTEQEAARPQPSVEHLFPHWEDKDVDEGVVAYRLRQAHADLERWLKLGVGEEMEAANLRSLIETSLFGGLERAEFNPALYSALSHAAWGLRNAEPIAIAKPAKLAAMASAVLELRENMFLDYSRAVDIVDAMVESGWNVDSPATAAFRETLSAAEDIDEEFKLGV